MKATRTAAINVAQEVLDLHINTSLRLDASVEVLNLSTRTLRCLRKARIDTVGRADAASDRELLNIRGFGVGSLTEVRARVATYVRATEGGNKPAGQVSFVHDYSMEETPIELLQLSTRPFNALRACRITAIQELVQYSRDDLLSINNLGAGSIAEIERQLEWFTANYPISLPDSAVLVHPGKGLHHTAPIEVLDLSTRSFTAPCVPE